MISISTAGSLPSELPLEVRSAVLEINKSLSVERPRILIVGWRESNHDERTRAYRYCDFWTIQRATRTSLNIPQRIGYVLFTRFLGHAQALKIVRRLTKGVGHSASALEIRPIREILRYVRIPKPEPRPSVAIPKEMVFARLPEVISAPPVQEPALTEGPSIGDLMEQERSKACTPPQALKDPSFPKFATELMETLQSLPDQRLSVVEFGRIAKRYFPDMPPGVFPKHLLGKGFLISFVTEGSRKAGYYLAGQMLARLVGAPPTPDPSSHHSSSLEHPLAKRMLELEEEVAKLPAVQEAKAQAQAKLDELSQEERRLLKIKETLNGLQTTLNELG